MFWIIFAIIMFVIAVIVPRFLKDKQYHEETVSLAGIRWSVRLVCIVLGLLCLLATSWIIVDSDKVGHLKRVYLASDLTPGRILAAPGQKGPQAEIIGPGFHFMPFVRVLNKFEEFPVIHVSEDHYRTVTTTDGRKLNAEAGEVMAKPWPEKTASKYLDAMYFMGFDAEEGPRGKKGAQVSVLPPGDWRLNHYLYQISSKEYPVTVIDKGYVGVVKCEVGDEYDGTIVPKGIIESFIQASVLDVQKAVKADKTRLAKDDGKEVMQKPPATKKVLTKEEAKKLAIKSMSVPLVANGYKGIWAKVLTPGKYYMNNFAYQITDIDTRIQTWPYKGGYMRKSVHLEPQDDGTIKQTITEVNVPVPEKAADAAILIRIEGWEVYMDSRVLVQVTPESAPYVVATVGGIAEVENKIVTPAYKSILRNVVGAKERQALEIYYEREELETLVEQAIIPQGLRTGVFIREVRFGDPVPPTALLVPLMRKQLAEEMKKTFEKERLTQEQRIKTEKAKAEADQQAQLMKAQIAKKAAEQRKEELKLLGEGREEQLKAEARGEKERRDVLGVDKVVELAKFEMEMKLYKEIAEIVGKNPGMVKVPRTLILNSTTVGSGNDADAVAGKTDLTGPAAILGDAISEIGEIKLPLPATQ